MPSPHTFESADKSYVFLCICCMRFVRIVCVFVRMCVDMADDAIWWVQRLAGR